MSRRCSRVRIVATKHDDCQEERDLELEGSQEPAAREGLEYYSTGSLMPVDEGVCRLQTLNEQLVMMLQYWPQL